MQEHHIGRMNISSNEKIGFALLGAGILTGVFLFLFNKQRRGVVGKRPPINIDIRYEIEKDADATLMAQSIVKVLRMVLMPLEKKIRKEDAKLIFVLTGDSWEIRMKNASRHLRHSVSKILEAREW